jgi:hypothetical protein
LAKAFDLDGRVIEIMEEAVDGKVEGVVFWFGGGG